MPNNANVIQAVGRRKTAIASVRMVKAAKSSLMVNGKTPKDYFKTDLRALIAIEAFAKAESAENYEVHAHVSGGGIAAPGPPGPAGGLSPPLQPAPASGRQSRRDTSADKGGACSRDLRRG